MAKSSHFINIAFVIARFIGFGLKSAFQRRIAKGKIFVFTAYTNLTFKPTSCSLANSPHQKIYRVFFILAGFFADQSYYSMHESLEALDHVRLNFSPESLHLLNLALAVIMFGVALEIKIEHFREILRDPKSAVIGFGSQFLALPLLTFLLVVAFQDYLSPTMALGMILVAACPGGNISNFMSSLSKANVALSVSLTALATVGAVFLTPLNFAFWGKMAIGVYSHASAEALVRPLEIDTFQMFLTVFIILGVPLFAGIFFNHKFPQITKKIVRPIKRISILIFSVIVIMALYRNFDHFLAAIQYIFLIVLIHNAVALSTGYSLGALFKRPLKDKKTLAIETGIQNSGLALVLIFNPKIFPPEMELGGMAIIAAWWGIWHIISGLVIAGFWTKFNFGLRKKQVDT